MVNEDGRAPLPRARVVRRASAVGAMDALPRRVEVPVSVGRLSGRFYDPVTGRKIPPEAR